MVWGTLYIFQADGEGAAEQVRGAERLTNHQFLTYYIRTRGADYAQSADMSSGTCLQRLQIQDITKFHAQITLYQFPESFLCETNLPTVEVLGF